MSLHIIVCIKPVPDPRKWGKLKLDPETLLLRRGDVPAVINPLDRQAVEQAIAIRETEGGRVTLVSMAPPDADEQVIEAMAMGADRACLLTDRAFAGADTLATARVLAAAVRKLEPWDLVFCGAYSADGSTAQVGPQLAELLGVPDLTHVVGFEVRGRLVRAKSETEDGYALYEAELPALATFSREANAPRLPSMRGIMQAARAGVERWTTADLELDRATVGLAGSPTQMLNVFTPPSARKGEMLQGTPNEVAARLLERLRADRLA
ncbi:MAG: electron transfer flavoprotein subunit beta/FixA family protein [Bacteroidales bacterium]